MLDWASDCTVFAARVSSSSDCSGNQCHLESPESTARTNHDFFSRWVEFWLVMHRTRCCAEREKFKIRVKAVITLAPSMPWTLLLVRPRALAIVCPDLVRTDTGHKGLMPCISSDRNSRLPLNQRLENNECRSASPRAGEAFSCGNVVKRTSQTRARTWCAVRPIRMDEGIRFVR